MADRNGQERPAKVGLVYDDVYLLHETGPDHPETPRRLTAIMERLAAVGLLDRLRRIAPLPADMDWIRAIHTDEYIERARRDIDSGRGELTTGDTAVCRESFRVALAAVGGAVAAAKAVMAGTVHNAFCAIRPPGHHAAPQAGMGFCIFNNAAIAARYAQQRCGAGKVLIVDWDIHHGNGTQDAFYEDATVLYFSTHLRGLYPMPVTRKGYPEETGIGAASGTNLNVLLGPGAGNREILEAFETRLLPTARDFHADLAIISAGFDSRVGDPLGALHVTDDCFAELTRMVMRLAPPGRVLSVLEGGYNLAGLALAVEAHIRALEE